MKVYYAHNMSIYGTKEERKYLKYMKDTCIEVVNPADLEEEYLASDKNGKDRFDFWYGKVDECDALVYTAIRDDSGDCYVGRGVLAEITHAIKTDKIVFFLSDKGNLLRLDKNNRYGFYGFINFSDGDKYFRFMKPNGDRRLVE